jgi:hypothetical protein
MRMMLFLAALCLSVAPAWGADGIRLTGVQAQETFTNARMTGVLSDGTKWSEKTTADGRVLDLLHGRKLLGAWAVQGERVCYTYYGSPSNHVCYDLYSLDGQFLFYEAETGELSARTTKVVLGR